MRCYIMRHHVALKLFLLYFHPKQSCETAGLILSFLSSCDKLGTLACPLPLALDLKLLILTSGPFQCTHILKKRNNCLDS